VFKADVRPWGRVAVKVSREKQDDDEVKDLVDVFRAEARRPAAEALAAMGAVDRAREVFAALIEEGAVNPNARPRAEDLALTAASLARAGIEPDEAMWARLRGIREGLVAPW
jgi:hypothetical protein